MSNDDSVLTQVDKSILPLLTVVRCAIVVSMLARLRRSSVVVVDDEIFILNFFFAVVSSFDCLFLYYLQ